MKFSYSWIKEFVNVKLPLSKVVDLLNAHSFEVELQKNSEEKYNQIFVAEITGFKKHPNADRLRVVEVKIGDQLVTPVVCGASNFEVGDKVVFAYPGAEVVDGHKDTGEKFIISKAVIRGVESQGMLCSAKELGLGADHAGIVILPKDTRVGTAYASLASTATNDIFEMDLVATNRSDVVSHRGMAMEIAAVTGSKFKDIISPGKFASKKKGQWLQVEVKEPALCPRYIGVVLDHVKINPAPKFISDRLAHLGVKSVNNIVDITNYVMLELGSPLHAFDADQISDGKIIVRKAKGGEKIKLLDQKIRELNSSMLIIADGSKPLAIAGVMGGMESAVSQKTTRVILEAAVFNNISIRTTARQLNLFTDATQRFLKGLPQNLPQIAQARAIGLLVQYAGARVVEIVDTNPKTPVLKEIKISPEFINSLLGIIIPPTRIETILRDSGFSVSANSKNLKVKIPFQRTDIMIPEDIVEEIGRIFGYDNFPSVPPIINSTITSDETVVFWKDLLKRFFTACGFNEAYNYSFVSHKDLEILNYDKRQAIALANSQSDDQVFLRPDLLPNLLKTTSFNLKYFDEVKFFEVGKIHRVIPHGAPAEEWQIAGIYAGKSDLAKMFRLVRGVVETLARKYLKEKVNFIEDHKQDNPYFSQSTVFGYEAKKIGRVGMVKNSVAQAFGIIENVVYFNIYLERILDNLVEIKPFQNVSRYPKLTYDVSILVAESITWDEILGNIRKAGVRDLFQIELFDEFRGKAIPAGMKSLSFHLVFQSMERTLREDEAKASYEKIVSGLKNEFNAEIRAGL